MPAPILNRPNQAPWLYTWALSAAYRSGTWLYDPDFASLQETEIWEKLNRDPVFRQGVAQRSHAVAGRQWMIQPFDQDDKQCVEAAKIMTGLVRKVRRFSSSRAIIAKNAIFRGRGLGWMRGRRTMESIAGSPVLPWWACHSIKDIDPRRELHDKVYQGNEVVGIETKLFNPMKGAYVVVTPQQRVALIRHAYDDEESRLGYGRGLLESLYFYYYAKTQILRYGLQGLQRWALGLIVGKVAADAPGSAERSSDDMRDELLTQLKKHDSSHVLVTDGRDSIDVVETSGTGNDIVQFLLSYVDDKITALTSGSVLPAGGGSNVGSLARAKVEQETSESLIQHDTDALFDTLTHEFIGGLWTLNRENFERCCPGAQMPSIVPVQQRIRDPETAATVIKTALECGIPLVQQEVMKALGFSLPREDQDTFDSIPAPAMNPDQMALEEKKLDRPAPVGAGR